MKVVRGAKPEKSWAHGVAVAGFLAGLLLIVTAATAAILSLQAHSRAVAWVEHTHRVTELLGGVLSRLQDTETGQRGYIITGDDRYLEPCHEAVENLAPDLDQLARLTADKPQQQERVQWLKSLAEARLNVLNEGIDLRRTSGFEAAAAAIGSGRGKAIMDQIREVVADMQQEESRQLAQREAAANARQRWLVVSTVAASGLGLLMVSLAAAYAWQSRRRVLAAHERLRESQERLRTSEIRYRRLFEAAHDGVLLLDSQTQKITDANPFMTELLGYSRDELVGKELFEIGFAKDAQAGQAALRQLKQTGHLCYEDLPLETKTGETREVEVVSNLYEEDGRSVIQCNVRDITERRRVEKALRDSELFHRQTLESIPGMVFTTRPDGYCDYQSQQWVDFTGVPMSEHLGDGWNQLIHPDDRPRAYAAWRAAVEGNASYDLEYRVRRYDGQYEWFKVLGRPIRDAAGQIVRWFGVAANINSLKQAEQQLKQLNDTLEQRVAERTAEVEARSAQLRELAAELTRAEQRERRRLAQVLHDHLQQLLVGAKFGTSTLRSRLAGDDDILQHLQHVDDLLDESILTSRSLTVELSPPVLSEGGLVPALRWLAGWMQEKHGLQVQVEADEAANPADEEIRTLLFQSVRELLFNVVKHARVDTATVRVACCAGKQVRVVVEDRGIGFHPDTAPRRTDASTGLGLLSMQERLEAMGSRLEMDSAPGKGARMTLVAPLHLHPQRQPQMNADERR